LKSSYKRIGDYIELVDERNKELNVDLLLGLSISKQFIPSVANTVGADMSNYKIIKKGQFACSIMQVRRDGKMPIALLQDFDEAIISQAYPVFRVIDENKLLPEYLMMWFSRSEFDRQATFHAVGGVRGSLEWDDFLDFELPIPSIEKQQEIVTEYNTITNRIALNEQLNQKLEETAQGIYKNWFVDFEFPNEEGKPYKSSGGRMEYNDELDIEIPEGWEVNRLEAFIDCNSTNYSKNNDFDDIHYLDTSNLTDNKIEEIKILKVGSDSIPSRAKRLVMHNDIVYSTVRPNLKHYGILKYPKSNMVISTGFTVLRVKSDYLTAEFIYQLLIQEDIIKDLQAKAEMSVSTYPSIKPEDLLKIAVALPKSETNNINRINKLLSATYELIHFNNLEISQLNEIKDLLLSKMTKVEVEGEIKI
jgi:type I restriction enzyme S subunit